MSETGSPQQFQGWQRYFNSSTIAGKRNVSICGDECRSRMV